MSANRFAISAGHERAAEIAASILGAGGNAVDAGVAACIALCVLHAEQVQLGGVAPMILRMAHDGQVRVIDGVGRWPATADRMHFEAAHRSRIPTGILRTVVPGAPDAWITALARFGTKSFAEVAEPARQLAAGGFEAHDDLVEVVEHYAREFRLFPENARIWMPDGRPPERGSVVRYPDLAQTLGRLIDAERGQASNGRESGLRAVRDLFYRGAIADEMVRHVTAQNGWLSMADLAAHQARIEVPTSAQVFGGTLFTCGPWSQGPALTQTLMIYEALLNMRGAAKEAGEPHRMIESLNLALADREALYGDPDFVDVPMDALLSADLAATRAAMISDDAAFGRLPPPSLVRLPGLRPADGDELAGPMLDTSVVSVVDADGNVFAATPSDSAADGPAVPGLGFVISTRGGQSFVDSGHPACVAPGKRPRVTACPMLYLSGDGRVIAGGGPGGDRQLQAMAQVLARHLAGGESLADAAAAPRAFTQSAPISTSPHLVFPGWVLVEREMPEPVVQALAACGHRVVRTPSKGILSASVCLVEASAAGCAAIGDPRRQGGQRGALRIKPAP
ncbi:MAG: gamma-glutamyltransferase family protein [Cypionkella sp.]